MAETTKIEWCDHTFNPWRGCTKVAAECQNCYADTLSKRNPKTLGQWGPNGTRVVAAESYWSQPLKWNREAERDGVRRRVFCASLSDVFEDWGGPMLGTNGMVLNAGPVGDGSWDRDRWWHCDHTDSPRITMSDVRRRLFALIDATPHLDWLLLTKRPENIRRMWIDPPAPDNAFHPAEYFMDAMHSRGWTVNDVASDHETRLALELFIACSEPTYPNRAKCRMGDLCEVIAKAFGTSVEMWRNLEASYLKAAPAERRNVFLGTSAGTQATADRAIPELLKCRDLSPVLFVSAEPLLEAVDFSRSLIYQKDYYCGVCADWFDSPAANDHCPNCRHEHNEESCPECSYDGEMEMVCPRCGIDGGNGGLSHADCCQREIENVHCMGIDWCIVGGESGHNARPMHPDWARSIRDQCAAAGVPFLFKQWGEWHPIRCDHDRIDIPGLGEQGDNEAVGVSTNGRHAALIHNGNRRIFNRVGKKAAGRLLDGVEHNEFPNPKQE